MSRISHAPRRFERRVAGIEYGVLDRLVGYALRRALGAVHEDFDAVLRPLDMTPQRFSAMVVIAANRGITQSMLGRVLGIARSGVVQVVDGLAARGWVAREAHGADARARIVALTPEGRAMLGACRRRVRAHDDRAAKRLTQTEKAALIALLDRLGPADPRSD